MTITTPSTPRCPGEIFAPLTVYAGRIPLAELMSWLRQSDIELADVQGYLSYHPTRYIRNLVFQSDAFQGLALCWRNGQRSPIHDHQGSSCGVKVLQGEATETLFEKAPNGMIYAVASRILRVGDVCGSQDNDIHQVSNLQAGSADLVTLHVYSPPLLSMNIYSLLNDSVKRFVDPINDEFVLGGGI